MKLIICICTYKRENELIKLLKSIECEENNYNIKLEKIIVDNYEYSNCKKKLIDNKIKNFNYYMEKNKGLSNARNKCLIELRKKSFDYAIFLDDDQVVTNQWFKEIIKVTSNKNKDIVKGNVIYVSNINTLERNNKINLYYPLNDMKDGQNLKYCGIGNTIISNKVINSGVKFDFKFNNIGGEDTDFFFELFKQGFEIVYNENFIVYEEVSKERLKLKYIIKRNFIAGISYLSVMKKNNEINVIKQIFKSIIKLIYGFIFTIFFNIISLKRSIKYLKKISQSLGEIYYLFGFNVKGIY